MPVPIKKQEKYDFPKTEPNSREGQEEEAVHNEQGRNNHTN